ncbi:MAG: hypothetical protein EBS61_12870, partial [Betaproteobacteria bacterium]|nr:hypothetical protein [Betaproteobacteria bacterium]
LINDEIEAQREEIAKSADLDLTGSAMEAGKVFGEGIKDAFAGLIGTDAPSSARWGLFVPLMVFSVGFIFIAIYGSNGALGSCSAGF